MLKDEVFEKLKCQLLDENKIVTYKTLSRQLNIHANEAKLYLNNFFNAYQDENCLNAYYAIIGTQDADDHIKHYRTAIVSAKNLENVKSRFSSLSSVQIYCIYRGDLVDKCSLYTADYETSEDVLKSLFHFRLSAIKNQNVKILPGRVTKAPESHKIEANIKPTSTNAQSCEKNEEPTKKNKNPDIFSLFQKKDGKKNASTKADVTSDGANSTVSSKSTKNEKNGERASVKQLFSKQIERNASKPLVKVEKSDSEKPLVVQPSKPNVEKEVSVPKRTAKKNHQRDDSDSEDQRKSKKHKRIITMDDSDSESESEEAKDKAQRNIYNLEKQISKCEVEDDEDHLIPPTPPTTATTPAAVTSSKRKWKVVTKTFQDEDGFFVTKKTKEYVTSSEESEEEPMQAPQPPKVQINKNKKQSSLISFFRQK